MIWLQDPPWIRWTVVILIAAVAIWTELGGDGTVQHPFAIAPIAPGEPLDDGNVEMRPVPLDLLPPVELPGYATRAFGPGEPIVSSGVSAEPPAAADGWWALEMDVPAGADAGDEVQVVLVDTGSVVPGRVLVAGGTDPLTTRTGSIAIPPEHAAATAVAASAGRVVVMLATG